MSQPSDFAKPAHDPVLYHEIIHALNPVGDGYYIDATLGAGGHAAGILEASMPSGQLLGLDVDPQAISIARKNLDRFGSRVKILYASYTSIREQVDKLGWPKVNGIMIDLGASSMQFDNPKRGFSFQSDGDLDMRFTPDNPLTASTIINGWSEEELSSLIYRFGEEPLSRKIARAIVSSRPITGTIQLAQVISSAIPHYGRIHPATRTFQAIRMAVNEELASIEQVLPQAIDILTTGGRLAVISFHSLEDRIVKEYFRKESKDCICPPRQPICTCGHKARIHEVNRKPIYPTSAEISRNPRSRSAKLRIAEKIS